MTDNYITEITSTLLRMTDELKAMRRDMPSKEDVLNLWNLRHDILMKPDLETILERLPTVLPATNPPVPGLQERFETVTGKLLDRVEGLESEVKAIWRLLRSAETGETRTRPDTGSSRMPRIKIEGPYATVTDSAGTHVVGGRIVDDGGSGNPPAAPCPETSGTEQRQDGTSMVENIFGKKNAL